MKIGIIGAGKIGGTLTRRLTKLGHDVYAPAPIPLEPHESERMPHHQGEGAQAGLFHEMAVQNLGALHRTARRLTRHTQDAEDLVQETCLRAWRSLHTYRPGTNPRAWLFRILRNMHVDRLRASSRAAKAAAEIERDERVPGAPDTPESLFMARLLDPEVRQALVQLPDAYRACVILADLEGVSYPKIMDGLGIPRGTVMSRLFRGRRGMRRLLTAFGREHGYLKASLRGERIAVFLLIATLSGFAPFAPMPHAAAQGSGGYQMVVGPTLQGEVTQKFATQCPYYIISVDGTPYSVSVELFNQVVVGSIVRFDGANWTVISGGISDPKCGVVAAQQSHCVPGHGTSRTQPS